MQYFLVMDNNDTKNVAVSKYLEAETVTEDSDNSSLSNFTDAVSEVNPFLDGINKVKDLIQELEESFRESSNVGNNLILRCVLLRGENQNLIHKIDEKNRNLSNTLQKKRWRFSVLNHEKSKSLENNAKRVTCTNPSSTSFHQPLVIRNSDEVDILHKTIGDLQKKLKERDKKIEALCERYLDLNANKNKMEKEFKSKIESLEKQLELTYNTLSEFQSEMETTIERGLSQTKNTYEALFLLEKSRCSKLMYEKVKLHHELKRLEDVIRRQRALLEDENKDYGAVKTTLDKSSSEPYMKHF